MSRLDRWKVWYQWNGEQNLVVCPVCRVEIMDRDTNSWQREHIFSVKYHGPDVFPNLVPICTVCNLRSNQYACTFDYMVDIGTLNEEQARNLKIETMKQICLFNVQCEYKTKGGTRCRRSKWGKDQEFCWSHYSHEYGVCNMDTSWGLKYFFKIRKNWIN